MNAVKPAAQKIGLLSRGSFRSALPAACVVPFPVTQDRSIHSTTRCESNPLFIGTAVAVAALTTRYTLQVSVDVKLRAICNTFDRHGKHIKIDQSPHASRIFGDTTKAALRTK